MLLFAILAVFIAGLMVGRTPEYLGKKIEQKEVKMAMLAIIATAACILVFTGAQLGGPIRARTATGIRPGAAIANLNNSGPHGFSEILYAYYQRHRQQRQRLRRAQRQHALVQPDASASPC